MSVLCSILGTAVKCKKRVHNFMHMALVQNSANGRILCKGGGGGGMRSERKVSNEYLRRAERNTNAFYKHSY